MGIPGGYQVALQGIIKSGQQDRSFSNFNLQNRDPAIAANPHDFTAPTQPNDEEPGWYTGPFDVDGVEAELTDAYATAQSEITGTSADEARRAVALDPNLLLSTPSQISDTFSARQLFDPRLYEFDPAVQHLNLSPIPPEQQSEFSDDATMTVSSGDTNHEVIQMVTRAEAARARRLDQAIADGHVETRDPNRSFQSISGQVGSMIDDIIRHRNNLLRLEPHDGMTDSSSEANSEFGFRNLGLGHYQTQTPVHTPPLFSFANAFSNFSSSRRHSVSPPESISDILSEISFL